jgi:hypothetical protein
VPSADCPWLEPYGAAPESRQIMWGAIVTLHGRYPRALGALKDEWWTDEAHTETLCALAVWLAEIDDAGQDPHEELAFQAQLGDYVAPAPGRRWRDEGVEARGAAGRGPRPAPSARLHGAGRRVRPFRWRTRACLSCCRPSA